MRAKTTPEQAAEILLIEVLRLVTLADSHINRKDSRLAFAITYGKIHLIAVLRRTGWLTDRTIRQRLHEQLLEIALANQRQLQRQWADHVSSPAALAWLHCSKQREANRELLCQKLDHDESYETFIQRGEGLEEKFFEDFLALCAGH